MNLFKFKFPIVLIVLTTLFIACDADDSAPEEEEFFSIVVDGLPVNLTYTNAIDLSNDNSIFLSGGLFPDDYTISVVADNLTSTGSISCAVNETDYSVRLGVFSGPNNDLTSYDDGDDTCQSTITITRNDAYIEGSFSSVLIETSSSTPETVIVSGTFKIREDQDN